MNILQIAHSLAIDRTQATLWGLGVTFTVAFVGAIIFQINSTQATLLTGAVLASTLLVLAVQLYYERTEAKYLSYERLRADFMTASLSLVQYPQILNYLYQPWKRRVIEGDEKGIHKGKAHVFLDTLLGLFERAWKDWKLKKISNEEWIQWREWLYALTFSDGFDDIPLDDVYDKGFVLLVHELIERRNKELADRPKTESKSP